jgi:DNA-directed RNA polymerase subunit RPC12/RpoP
MINTLLNNPQYKLRPSHILNRVFRIANKPMSLEGRTYLQTIHDGYHPHLLLKTGRQVEKSTTLAVKLLTNSLLIPGFQSVYVVPRMEQAKVFSSQKLDTFIHTSEVIQKFFISHRVKQNKFQKEFENGSMIWLRSAYLSPDAIRGLSADLLGIDEVQDIITDNIPVMLEVLSHSAYDYAVLAGTPKTLQAPIEGYWQESTKHEWAIKCSHCGKWNIMGDEIEKNIAKEGLICRYCGKPLDLHNDKQSWVITGDKDAYWHGFHVPQLIVPWIQWDKIWMKYSSSTYSRAKFYNEVLGLSFAISDTPIQEAELIASCDPNREMLLNPPKDSKEYFMGIDWSTTSGQHFDEATRGYNKKSYTVVTIGYVDSAGKIHVVYFHRFMGAEADNMQQIINTIIGLAKKYRVRLIGADWGVGSGGANSQIRQYYLDNKSYDGLVEMYYSGNLNAYSKWDPEGMKYVLSRTAHLTNLFGRIKHEAIDFPKWEQSEEYLKDFLSIYNAVDKLGRLYYDHEKSKPDDTVHSVAFMLAAIEYYYGQLPGRRDIYKQDTIETEWEDTTFEDQLDF